MNKRKLHHTWKLLRSVSYWYFLAAFLIFGVTAILALRHNNLTAVALRKEVLRVDKENGDTEAALRKLRKHVYGHMNANLASDTSVYPPRPAEVPLRKARASRKIQSRWAKR